MAKKNNNKKKDLNKLYLNNINKHNSIKILFPVLLIIVSIIIGFDMRSGPIDLEGLDDRIEQNTYNQIRNIISQQIDINYPNLNQNNRESAINKEYQKIIETGQYNINGEILIIKEISKQNSEQIKSQFKADNNQTYLNAIDPYYFLGLSQNYNKNGHTGTIIDDKGEPIVNYRLAPIGILGTFNPEFHVWLESKLYDLNNLDESSDIGEKVKAIYLIPVIFAIFSVIPTFLIIRKFSNDITAFFGSLLLVSIGTFVSRTIAGFVDTDAYNVFFPLLITSFIIYSLASKNSISYILIIMAGLFQGIYLWAWGAGWFIFIFIILSLIIYITYLLLIEINSKILEKSKENHNSKLNHSLIKIILFVISSTIFSILITSKNILTISFNAIIGGGSNLVTINNRDIWPNVLSSVAELNNASFGAIIGSVGGKAIFLIAMIGLLFMSLDFKKKFEKFNQLNPILGFIGIIWFSLIIYNNLFVSLTANSGLIFIILLFLPIGLGLLFSLINSNQNNKIFLIILISIWIAGTIYMSLNGVRFILLLAPAFAIAFGLGMYYISKTINRFINKETNFKTKMPGLVIISIIFLTLYIPIYTNAQNISKNTTPNFDDAWYETMYKIRDNSNKDAIITSWWDFGHFFAVTSERGVTFDGGTQGTPRSHWVGKLLMENDEQKSHDILRMLTCGGNEAHNTMLNFTNGETKDAVKINKIIYETLGEDLASTKSIIKNNKYYNYTDEQISKIMSFLACEKPVEDFVITSQDMVGKAGVWAHWGSWDFTKKYVHDNYKSKTSEEIALDIDENKTVIEQYISELNNIDIQSKTQNIKREDLLNRWFADYPSYIPLQNRYTYPCGVENTTLVCQNGLDIDLTNGNISGPLTEQIKLNNLILPTNEKDINIIKHDETGNIDAIILPTRNGFEVLLAAHPLGASLFTKLFYLDGFGTTMFEKFDDVQSVTGVRVKTWKVIWNQNETITEIGDLSGTNIESIQFNATKEEIEKIIGEEINSSK